MSTSNDSGFDASAVQQQQQQQQHQHQQQQQQQQQQWMQALFAAQQSRGGGQTQAVSQSSGIQNRQPTRSSCAETTSAFNNALNITGVSPMNSQALGMVQHGNLAPFNPGALLAAYAAQLSMTHHQPQQQQPLPQPLPQYANVPPQVAPLVALQGLIQSVNSQVPQATNQVLTGLQIQYPDSALTQAYQNKLLQMSPNTFDASQIRFSAPVPNSTFPGAPGFTPASGLALPSSNNSSTLPMQTVSLWNNSQSIADSAGAKNREGSSPSAPPTATAPIKRDEDDTQAPNEAQVAYLPGLALAHEADSTPEHLIVGVERSSGSGPVLVPCRSRTAPSGHNIKTGYLLIPDDASHGMDLLCSHSQCRNEGVKFLYCAVCQLPVAKRNFRKRHSHLDILLNQLPKKSPATGGAQDTVSSTFARIESSSNGTSAMPSQTTPQLPLVHSTTSSKVATQKFAAASSEENTSSDEVFSKEERALSRIKIKLEVQKPKKAPAASCKSTLNGHTVSFSGSYSEPPSSLSNVDSNSKDSGLSTAPGHNPQPVLNNKHKLNKALPRTKASKTMAEALSKYNSSNKGNSIKNEEQILLSVLNAPKRGDSYKEKITDKRDLNHLSHRTLDQSISNGAQEINVSHKEDIKQIDSQGLQKMDLWHTSENIATSSMESSADMIQRQNQAAAEQAFNLDETTTKMWESLLHERPSSNNVNDFREWLLRCLSVSSQFEGNKQRTARVILTQPDANYNNLHSSSARCSSVSSLSSETREGKSSIVSSFDAVVKSRNSEEVCDDGESQDKRSKSSSHGEPKCSENFYKNNCKKRKVSGPLKKRFQQEPHILELPENFRIDTPSSSGLDGGSSSNTKADDAKVASLHDAAALADALRETIESSVGNVIPVDEEARRKKHAKKRQKRDWNNPGDSKPLKVDPKQNEILNV